MKIYKFKDLRQDNTHSHFFQMIEYNKVWCAAPGTLNDINEFNFRMDYQPSNRTGVLLDEMIKKLGNLTFPSQMTTCYALLNNKIEEFTKPQVSEIINKCRESIGVTSFSTSKSDPWLWENYGGDGFGGVVEFEVPDEMVGETYHLVNYVEDNIFHIDIFLESQLGQSDEIFRNILCTKTLEWRPEREIRFLGKTPNVNITFDAPVTGVIIGKSLSKPLANRIEECCSDRNISIYQQ